jgi:hypothetical protein
MAGAETLPALSRDTLKPSEVGRPELGARKKGRDRRRIGTSHAMKKFRPDGKLNLVTVPVEVAAILIYVAILATKFAALVACRSIVSVVQIAAQLATIVSDLGLVVTDIAVQTSVAIPGQRGRHAHSDEQENSSNRAFHKFSSDRNSRLVN